MSLPLLQAALTSHWSSAGCARPVLPWLTMLLVPLPSFCTIQRHKLGGTHAIRGKPQTTMIHLVDLVLCTKSTVRWGHYCDLWDAAIPFRSGERNTPQKSPLSTYSLSRFFPQLLQIPFLMLSSSTIFLKNHHQLKPHSDMGFLHDPPSVCS